MAQLFFAVALFMALPAFADEPAFTTYAISSRHPDVRGGYSLGGYSESRVLDFLRRDCRGPLGLLILVGKPQQKGDYLVQNFKIACPDGLAERYPSSMAAITVRRQPDGRDLAEVFTLDATGRMVMLREYR